MRKRKELARRWIGGAALLALLTGFAVAGLAAETINFPATAVGSTRTVQFTYTLTATSETSATVTITPPSSPFGITGALQFGLSPGQSRTFGVTFSPTSAGQFSGSFTITAVGGFPPQSRTTQVLLTGSTGTTTGDGSEISLTDLFGGLFGQPTEVVPTPPEDELVEAKLDAIAAVLDGFAFQLGESDIQRALLEVKLDDMGRVLDEFRDKLDNLGYWLGELTVGWPIGIEPHSTNPVVQTNLWETLAKIEAKLDRMGGAPTEITIIDVYALIVDINVVIIQINQWILDLGGDTEALEAKLDQLGLDLGLLWLDLLSLSDDVQDLKDALDTLSDDVSDLSDDVSDLSDDVAGLSDDIFDLSMDVFDNYLEIIANGVDIQQNNADILANNAAILANGAAIAGNAAAIGANAAAINALSGMMRSLLASNQRIEDKLNQSLGYPAAPDASKITLVTGGGPLPAAPWTATVEGSAGAVAPGATVTIYWPIGDPSVTMANGSGAFQATVVSGNATYLSVEVSQTDGQGRESARTVVWAGP